MKNLFAVLVLTFISFSVHSQSHDVENGSACDVYMIVYEIDQTPGMDCMEHTQIITVSSGSVITVSPISANGLIYAVEFTAIGNSGGPCNTMGAVYANNASNCAAGCNIPSGSPQHTYSVPTACSNCSNQISADWTNFDCTSTNNGKLVFN